MAINIAAIGKAVTDGKMREGEAAQAFLTEAGKVAWKSPSYARALAEIAKGYAILSRGEGCE